MLIETFAPSRRRYNRHLMVRLLLGLTLLISSVLHVNANDNTLPSLGDTSSAQISLQQEYKLGRAWLTTLRNRSKELNDPLLYDYLEHLLYRLAEHSQLQDRRLELVVIDNPSLNAFAVPGGIIGVNSGLLLYAHREQELASVLAHELAHLSQRHYARKLEATKNNTLPSLAALLTSIAIAATSGGSAGVAAIATTQATLIDQQLRFSRSNEQEADSIGLQTLVNADIDPHAMASMFDRMLAAQRLAGSRPPEFLLTHPLTESRIADARSRAEQLSSNNSEDNTRLSLNYQLMRNRVRLTLATSPSHAIKLFKSELENNDTIIGRAAQYGLALAYSKAGQHIKANKTLQPLLASDPNRISYLVTYAQINQTKVMQSTVEQRLKKNLALNPGNYPLSMALANNLIGQHRYKDAQILLKKISLIRPQDPAVWLRLAEANGFDNNTVGAHLANAEYFMLTGNMDAALNQLNYALQKSDKNFQLSSKIEQRKKDIINAQKYLDSF